MTKENGTALVTSIPLELLTPSRVTCSEREGCQERSLSSKSKGSKEKQRQSVKKKKISVVAGKSNPGPLALATSALATEL